MSISEMIEAIEGTLDDTPSKYVIESLVDFLTDDTEWTLQNISDEPKKKIIQLANKLGQLKEYEAHQVIADPEEFEIAKQALKEVMFEWQVHKCR